MNRIIFNSTAVMKTPSMKILVFILNVHSTLASYMYDDSLKWMDYFRSELVKVNCDDPSIRAAVDQQIIDFQNNNPSFFRTKASHLCSPAMSPTTIPYPTYAAIPGISYAAVKAETERDICFERRSKRKPTWCSQLSQQTTCTTMDDDPCYSRGGIERIKRSYCGIRNDLHGPTNVDNILRRYHWFSRCEDFGNAVKTAFDSFLANPKDYIERQLTIETTLENSRIWPYCIDSYLAALDVETELGCSNIVTASERQTMEDYDNWGVPVLNSAKEEAKRQLINAAIAAIDARKYLCLARYGMGMEPWSNVANLRLVNNFVIDVKNQMKWCTPYSNQLSQLNTDIDRGQRTELIKVIHMYLDSIGETMLKENNYNPQFALCMMRVMADKMFSDELQRVQDFCLRMRRFVSDRYIDTIYQTPDCRAANLAAGVNVRDLGNAIVNREYETIRQLNRSMRGMDRHSRAAFDSCLSENLMSSLGRTCNSGQYQTRTNNIRIFVERTMADPSLYSELRDIAVRRKLMEGPYPGAAGSMCDAFAIIEGFTNNNQKRERIQLMKKYIFPMVKDLKRYEDLVNLRPSIDCYNTGMLVDPIKDLGDNSGFWYMDPGARSYDSPETCNTNRTIDKRQACRKHRFCEIINQVSDQTCYGMTNLRTTIDIEWQKVMNAVPNVNFNFYSELEEMASTIRNNFNLEFNDFHGRNRERLPGRDLDSWKCAVKLMAKKVQAYRNPINECYIQHSLTEYPFLRPPVGLDELYASYRPNGGQPNRGTPAVWPFNDYGPDAPTFRPAYI